MVSIPTKRGESCSNCKGGGDTKHIWDSGYQRGFLAYRDAVMIEVPGGHQPFRLAVLVGAQKKAVVLVLNCLDRHVEWEALGVQAAERALNQVFNFLAKKRSHVQFGIGMLHEFLVPVISSVVKDLLLLGSGLDNKNHKQSSEKKWHLERMPHRRDWPGNCEFWLSLVTPHSLANYWPWPEWACLVLCMFICHSNMLIILFRNIFILFVSLQQHLVLKWVKLPNGREWLGRPTSKRRSLLGPHF